MIFDDLTDRSPEPSGDADVAAPVRCGCSGVSAGDRLRKIWRGHHRGVYFLCFQSTQIGTQLFHVNATDGDLSNTGFNYSIVTLLHSVRNLSLSQTTRECLRI